MQFNDLGKQWKEIREICLQKVDELGHDGGYIGGKRVEEFEKQFSNYIGVEHSIGTSNGTDALKLAFQSLDLNAWDTVIMPANTFIADYIAVKHLPQKNKPRVVLIDHNENYTLNTKDLEEWLKIYRPYTGKVVVVAVHLYGHSCDMEKILELKKKHDFILLEDCSQSHGTKFQQKMTGSFGEISIFSLYPGKNLGALGDAGIVSTNDSSLAERVKALRNYGSKKKYYYDYLGHNNRLDPIQCIFLSEKLKRLDAWNEKKRKIAKFYTSNLDRKKIEVPIVNNFCEHSYHIYCVRVENRNEVIKKMEEKGIPTIIHYPIPIQDTAIWDSSYDSVFTETNTRKNAEKILSLPMHPFLTEEEISKVVNSLNSI